MGSYLESIETQTKSFSTEPCYCRQKISLEDIILQVVSAQLIDESEIASLLLLYCLNLLTANEGNEEAISQIQTLMTEIGHKFGIGSKQA